MGCVCVCVCCASKCQRVAPRRSHASKVTRGEIQSNCVRWVQERWRASDGMTNPESRIAADQTTISLCFKCINLITCVLLRVHTGTVMRQDGWKWLLQIILAVNTQWTHHLESKDYECQQQIVTRSLLLCFPARKSHSSLELCWLIEPLALVSVFCLRESTKCRPWNEWTNWIVM